MDDARKRILAKRRLLGLAMATAALVDCGGPHETGSSGARPCLSVIKTSTAFQSALRRMQAYDQSGWTDEGCREVAALFLRANADMGAGSTSGRFYDSMYNAAVCHQRCRQDEEARALYEKILADKPDYHRARVQLALYRFYDDGQVDKAIAELERAIEDAGYRNEEAFTHLARLQLRKRDLAGAYLNVRRALAVNERYMPAHVMLTAYHLQKAKHAAGRADDPMRVAVDEPATLDPDALELALEACEGGLRLDPRHAPMHNMCGILHTEAGAWKRGAEAFEEARRLDPRAFAAHVNFAAVHLRHRSFAVAEGAFRHAIALRKRDYDAHIGLALAIRGQITNDNRGQKVRAAEQALEAARSIDPERPEYYFNRGLLLLDASRAPGEPERRLREAVKMFEAFIDKAGEDLAHIEAVEIAKQRIHQITQPLHSEPHPWD